MAKIENMGKDGKPQMWLVDPASKREAPANNAGQVELENQILALQQSSLPKAVKESAIAGLKAAAQGDNKPLSCTIHRGQPDGKGNSRPDLIEVAVPGCKAQRLSAKYLSGLLGNAEWIQKYLAEFA